MLFKIPCDEISTYYVTPTPQAKIKKQKEKEKKREREKWDSGGNTSFAGRKIKLLYQALFTKEFHPPP